MRMTITGINFNYENGFENEYTSIDLNFITSGGTYSISGPITVSKEDYQQSSGSNEQLRALIKQQIINDLQA